MDNNIFFKKKEEAKSIKIHTKHLTELCKKYYTKKDYIKRSEMKIRKEVCKLKIKRDERSLSKVRCIFVAFT